MKLTVDGKEYTLQFRHIARSNPMSPRMVTTCILRLGDRDLGINNALCLRKDVFHRDVGRRTALANVIRYNQAATLKARIKRAKKAGAPLPGPHTEPDLWDRILAAYDALYPIPARVSQPAGAGLSAEDKAMLKATGQAMLTEDERLRRESRRRLQETIEKARAPKEKTGSAS